MKKLVSLFSLVAALVFSVGSVHADPTHVGVGFYFGSQCPLANDGCWHPAGPDSGYHFTPVTSNALYVTFPNGTGYATFAAGWLDNNVDADAYSAPCNSPASWTTHGVYGTMNYDDGELVYSGACVLDAAVIDTSYTALPGGDITCWKCLEACTSSPPLMWHPNMYFIRKLKIQSCTSSSHVRTNRFIGIGCDGYTESTYINDPYCPYMNTNWINLSFTGAP